MYTETKEKLDATFCSPKFYYGISFSYRWDLKKDPKGYIVRNGERYILWKIVTAIRFCDFPNETKAREMLESTYNWWRDLHPNHTYRSFDDCIQKFDPECKEENPLMHGLKLVMKPQ